MPSCRLLIAALAGATVLASSTSVAVAGTPEVQLDAPADTSLVAEQLATIGADFTGTAPPASDVELEAVPLAGTQGAAVVLGSPVADAGGVWSFTLSSWTQPGGHWRIVASPAGGDPAASGASAVVFVTRRAYGTPLVSDLAAPRSAFAGLGGPSTGGQRARLYDATGEQLLGNGYDQFAQLSVWHDGPAPLTAAAPVAGAATTGEGIWDVSQQLGDMVVERRYEAVGDQGTLRVRDRFSNPSGQTRTYRAVYFQNIWTMPPQLRLSTGDWTEQLDVTSGLPREASLLTRPDLVSDPLSVPTFTVFHQRPVYVRTLSPDRDFIELHYDVVVPPGGSAELVHEHGVRATEAAAQDAAAALTDTVGPEIDVSSPAPGATTGSREVVVAGTARDESGVSAVEVDRAEVTPGPDGAFSRTVTLPDRDGTHPIEITARDGAGRETTTTRTVTLARSAGTPATTGGASATTGTDAPPAAAAGAPAPPAAPAARGLRLSRPTIVGGGTVRSLLRGLRVEADLTGVDCRGRCRLTVQLVLSPADAKRLGLTRGRRATVVGRAARRAAAARARIAVPLSRRARRRLRAARRLTLTVLVSVTDAAGASTSVERRVTLRR